MEVGFLLELPSSVCLFERAVSAVSKSVLFVMIDVVFAEILLAEQFRSSIIFWAIIFFLMQPLNENLKLNILSVEPRGKHYTNRCITLTSI